MNSAPKRLESVTSELTGTGPSIHVVPTPAARGARRSLRMGIGSRLALGLAGMGIALLGGHIIASRTTGLAVDAVRSMQTEHEPRAQRASAVVETLVAYDRSITEYLQDGGAAGIDTITKAADALDGAVRAYSERTPNSTDTEVASIPGSQL